MSDLVNDVPSEVAEFMQGYVELLLALGGDELVASMRTEVNFRVKQGAELPEALAEHYQHTRKKYGLQ